MSPDQNRISRRRPWPILACTRRCSLIFEGCVERIHVSRCKASSILVHITGRHVQRCQPNPSIQTMTSTREQRRAQDDRRRANLPYRQWYHSARWLRMRSRQLRAHPFCQVCERATPPRLVRATVCHHKQAHRGDARLFWSADNLESCCADCHDRELQGQESRGYSTTVGADGIPIDGNHPWRSGGR
jgi:5-methylcytosine-specific restriction enzyme A